MNISKLEADQIEYEATALIPGEVFVEIMPMIKSLAEEKRLTFEAEEKSDKSIRVDRRRFKQVLLNLVSNAVKYTPLGGSFQFGNIELSQDQLRVYVSDSGVGIPVADQEEIFEQFHRASNVVNLHPGTGTSLGLYHSKRLVEDMGGKISFESVGSGGSTFYLDFPISNAVETQALSD